MLFRSATRAEDPLGTGARSRTESFTSLLARPLRRVSIAGGQESKEAIHGQAEEPAAQVPGGRSLPADFRRRPGLYSQLLSTWFAPRVRHVPATASATGTICWSSQSRTWLSSSNDCTGRSAGLGSGSATAVWS